MIKVQYDGKTQPAFLLKKGPANLVIIPVNGLLPLDIQRLRDLEEREGEMLANMRDFKLDNGLTALTVYQDLIRTVPNPEAEAEVEAPKAAEAGAEKDSKPAGSKGARSAREGAE